MPPVNPNYAEGFPRVGHSPALDALQQLGSASPSSGMVANPNRLTEAPDAQEDPFPSGAGRWPPGGLPPSMTPPPAAPPSEVSGQDQILASLRMAYPANRQFGVSGPVKNMAPERREKPSVPALEG